MRQASVVVIRDQKERILDCDKVESEVLDDFPGEAALAKHYKD